MNGLKNQRSDQTRKHTKDQLPPAVPESLLKPQLPGEMANSLGIEGVAKPSIQIQAARLADPRFQTAQRQTMARNIGKTQGNRHLARAIQASRQTSKPATRSNTAIQAKLAVGAADDTYEREADSVADAVMRMPASATPPPADNTGNSSTGGSNGKNKRLSRMPNERTGPASPAMKGYRPPRITAVQRKTDDFFSDFGSGQEEDWPFQSGELNFDLHIDDDLTEVASEPAEDSAESAPEDSPEQIEALSEISDIDEEKGLTETANATADTPDEQTASKEDNAPENALEEGLETLKKEAAEDKQPDAEKEEPAAEEEGESSAKSTAPAEEAGAEAAEAESKEEKATQDKAKEAPQPEGATKQQEAEKAQEAQPAKEKAKPDAQPQDKEVEAKPVTAVAPAPEQDAKAKAAPLSRAAPPIEATPVSKKTDPAASTTPTAKVQRRGGGDGFAVAPATEQRIQMLSGGGQPLPDKVRVFFEERMNADFSNIRIHTGANAVQISREIGARAFTLGKQIAFNSGEYRPDTDEGRRLLAHELTHTIQQGAASRRNAQAAEEQSISRKAIATGSVQAQMASTEAPSYTLNKAIIAAPINQSGQSAKYPSTTTPTKKSTEGQNAAEPQPQEQEAAAETMHLEQVKEIPVDFNVGEFVGYLVESVKPFIGEAPQTAEAGANYNPGDGDVAKAGQVFKTNTENAGKEVKEETAKSPNSADVTLEDGTPFPPPSLTFEPKGVDMNKAFPPKPATPPKNEELEKKLSSDTASEYSQGAFTGKDMATWDEPKSQKAESALQGIKEAHESAEVTCDKNSGQAVNKGKADGRTALEKAYDNLESWEDYRKQKGYDLQGDTKGKTEKKHAQIAGEMDKIYRSTKEKVTQVLARIDTQHIPSFDGQIKKAKSTFKTGVRSDVKKERGFWGGLKDKILGRSDEVKQKIKKIHTKREKQYLSTVRSIVQKIGRSIGESLKLAKQHIAAGRQSMDNYIARLPAEDQKIAAEMAQRISKEFDGLENDVNKKQEEVVDGIATKCLDVKTTIDAEREQLKEDNRDLLGKLTGVFTPVVDMFKQMKDMLFSVGKLGAAAIKLFFKDPGKFVKGAFAAVKEGFKAIPANFGNLAKGSFMTWLVGKLGGTITNKIGGGLGKLTIAGVIMSVLGLDYDKFRGEAMQSVGEEAVNEAEGGELGNLKKNPMAVWSMARQQAPGMVGEVITMVKQIVATSLLSKGAMFVISLLSPATALLKAAKVLIDVIKWFFTGGGLMLGSFVNMVLAALISGAQGNIARGALYVLSVVQDGLPLLLDGFMMMLGMGANAIGSKVKTVIKKFSSVVKKVNSKLMRKFKSYAKVVRAKRKTLALARDTKNKVTQNASALSEKSKRFTSDTINRGTRKAKEIAKPVGQAVDRFTPGAKNRATLRRTRRDIENTSQVIKNTQANLKPKNKQSKKLYQELQAQKKQLAKAKGELKKAQQQGAKNREALQRRKEMIEGKIRSVESKLKKKDKRLANQIKGIESNTAKLKQLKREWAEVAGKLVPRKTKKLKRDVNYKIDQLIKKPAKDLKKKVKDYIDTKPKLKTASHDSRRYNMKSDRLAKYKKRVKESQKKTKQDVKKLKAQIKSQQSLFSKLKNKKKRAKVKEEIRKIKANIKKTYHKHTILVKKYQSIKGKFLGRAPQPGRNHGTPSKPRQAFNKIKQFAPTYLPTHAVKPINLQLGTIRLGDDYRMLIPVIEKIVYAGGDPTKQQNIKFGLKVSVSTMFGGKHVNLTAGASVEIAGTVDVLANDGSQYVAGMIVYGGNIGGGMVAKLNQAWVGVKMMGHKYRGAGQIAFHWWKWIRDRLRGCLNQLPFVDIGAIDETKLANPADAEDPPFQDTEVAVSTSDISAGGFGGNLGTWVEISPEWRQALGKGQWKGDVNLKERQVTVSLASGYSGLIKELYYFDPERGAFKPILYDFYVQGKVGASVNTAQLKAQAASLFASNSGYQNIVGAKSTLVNMFWALKSSGVLPAVAGGNPGFDVQIRWRADVAVTVFEGEDEWNAGESIRCIPRQCDVNLFKSGNYEFGKVGPIKVEGGYEGWGTVDQHFYPHNIEYLVDRFASCMWRGDGRAEMGDQGVGDALALLEDQKGQVNQMLKNIGELALAGKKEGIYSQVLGSVGGHVTQSTVNKLVNRCKEIYKQGENAGSAHLDSALLEYLTLRYYGKRDEWNEDAFTHADKYNNAEGQESDSRGAFEERSWMPD